MYVAYERGRTSRVTRREYTLTDNKGLIGMFVSCHEALKSANEKKLANFKVYRESRQGVSLVYEE
jgi:hypothetical protein